MCKDTDLKVILKFSRNGELLCGAWLLKSFHQRKDKGYYRIPPILSRSKPKKQALRVERRATRLARSRRGDFAADTTEFYRVCGDHFISSI